MTNKIQSDQPVTPWPRFYIEFDFDYVDPTGEVINDPPTIYIRDDDTGVEVMEDPIPVVEKPGSEDDHWQPGPFAQKLLKVMNEAAEQGEL